jgi:riboflavin kinase/FMN adenylyltransferase
MHICERLKAVEPYSGRLGLTIANFEGFHRGHREIIDALVRASRAKGLYSAVLTFSQHPVSVLAGREPERLWSPTDRIRCFEDAGIDLLISMNFTPEFASLTPREFLDSLAGTLSPRVLCLGAHFRFGGGNAGDVAFLEESKGVYGYALVTVDDYLVDGAPVSSTRTREAVKKGNIRLATELLGREYCVSLVPLERSGKVLIPFIEHSAVPARGRYRGVMEVPGLSAGRPGKRATCTVRIDNKLFFPEMSEGFDSGTLIRFCFERAEREEK